jgi:quinoprotein glucose dehydrogenase
MRIKWIGLLLLFMASCRQAKKEYLGWDAFGGGKENIHYSSAVLIDTGNVQKLVPVWEYHTGDADTVNHSQIQCNPIMVHGVLYGTSPTLRVFALDALSGKPKWVFNPVDANQNKTFSDFILNNNRGVTYWEDGNDRRIFYTAGSWLYALRADSGTLIREFGKEGRINLHEGLGRDVSQLYVAATSPGIVFKDLLIMGSRVSEGSDAAPGYIRAYDTRTGAQRWVFHTIPQPGEEGYDSWEDPNAWKHIGGANCWSGFALDEERGMVFVPLGSASFDFYGGMRKGAGLFADCLLALDAATGKKIWHFQDVHHDLWDKDLPTPPALVSVIHDGKKVDAVAQPTKTGFVFLFDRETGKPLFPIEEKPVPQGPVLPGEKTWPTQPFPRLPRPFARQSFTVSDINQLLPDSSYRDIRRKLAGYKTGNPYNPPSREGTIILPGFDGGAEWGGPAFDPQTGILYVNANDIPWVLTMVPVNYHLPSHETLLQAGQRIYAQLCMACHGTERQGAGNYPSLLNLGGKYSDSGFANLISTGRRMMPSFKRLGPEDKEALAAFVLNLKQKKFLKYNPPPVKVDSFLNLPFSNTGWIRFLSKEGYPAIQPPWGTLTAIDLNTGAQVWQIPLGEYPEFKKKGIITGTENYGGPVVTAGGLLFIAATRDGEIRAFNKRTGQLLWEYQLPVPGYATPAMYALNGKQYLVIACGGGKLGSKSGDTYLAFSLPDL